jgi:dynein heavy chain
LRPSHTLGTKGALLFQAAREVWAKTLWMNLNAETLLDGMQRFIGEFKRFNDSVKQMPVGQFLDVHMKQFKNSVPLFVELKNEALRKRHWDKLMDKTGECDSVFNDFLQAVGKRR